MKRRQRCATVGRAEEITPLSAPLLSHHELTDGTVLRRSEGILLSSASRCRKDTGGGSFIERRPREPITMRKLFQWFFDQRRRFDRPIRRTLCKRRPNNRAFLQLEQLETRVTPTAYTWTNGGGDNTWENPANWAGGMGSDYPGWNATTSSLTTTDTATFSGGNASVTMSTRALTLDSLSVNLYTGTITLNKNLTLNNGGSMNSATIIQGAGMTGTTLTILGGTFSWMGSDINPGTVSIGNLVIGATAEMDFNNATGNTETLGDNVSNYGTLKLANTNPITLNLRPTITNETTGTILITVANTDGLDRPTGDAKVTIQNSGTIRKTTDDTGTYVINEPVNNKAAGAKIQVDAGTLKFLGDDPTTGFGINQTAGTIQVSGGATLFTDSGISQSVGTIKTSGTGTATISGC